MNKNESELHAASDWDSHRWDVPKVEYAVTIFRTEAGETYVKSETEVFGRVFRAEEGKVMDLFGALCMCHKTFNE